LHDFGGYISQFGGGTGLVLAKSANDRTIYLSNVIGTGTATFTIRVLAGNITSSTAWG
jgi:hypothetical protein